MGPSLLLPNLMNLCADLSHQNINSVCDTVELGLLILKERWCGSLLSVILPYGGPRCASVSRNVIGRFNVVVWRF